MQFHSEQLDQGITRVALVGRLDIEGAQAVDMKFNVLAGAVDKLIVDMAEVSFLASMGLRTLMTCARTVGSKGKKMVIAAPQPNIDKVLRASGMDEVVGIYPDLASAKAALG